VRRYRGDKESHDIGMTVGESDSSFQHWNRLWDIYHNRQLLATFKAIAQHSGLKVQLFCFIPSLVCRLLSGHLAWPLPSPRPPQDRCWRATRRLAAE
jgi:hypothetical protein